MRADAAGRRRRGRDRRPGRSARRAPVLARGDGHRLRGVRRPSRRRYAAQAAQAAFDLADRLEGELSRFRSNSDITRVNHLAAGESVRVGAATLECLVIARHLFDLTGGTFDPSIGTGLATLELDADDFQIRRRPAGCRLTWRHRQGLRGRSDGGTAGGLGASAGARPRGLQLGPGTRAARGPRRLAADPQRSVGAVTRARPPLGAPDGTGGLRPAQGRSHRGPSHGRTRPRPPSRVGSSRGPVPSPARDREWRQAPSPTP